jgi:hypothetical protein
MLKVGAIGGIFALRFALVRRNKSQEHEAQGSEAGTAAAAQTRRRNPHPVSRKKKRRRRR